MWAHFFNRPKRNYNPYMYKLKDYPDYIIYDSKIMNSYKNKWNEFFKNENPIYLEIGSGNGNFAIKNGEKYLNRNHIALELKFKRLVLSAEKAKKRTLNNVAFLRRRGEEVLDFLGEEEVEGVYINFPDPWEGREKNRIISQKLFKTLDIILKKGGKLFFKTDHNLYYSDVLELMKEIKGYKIIYNTDDLYSSEKIVDNLSTEFEDLFVIRRGMKINYIEIQKEEV